MFENNGHIHAFSPRAGEDNHLSFCFFKTSKLGVVGLEGLLPGSVTGAVGWFWGSVSD